MLRLGRISALLVLLVAGGCSDECSRDLKAYAFEQPGPWGVAAADVFEDTETVVSGTLTWVGPASQGELDPDLAKTTVTLEVMLDRDSAVGVGDTLGACDGRFEIDATLGIVTADGALNESIPIVLIASGGLNSLSASADLTGYDFDGALELGPAWAESEMQLWLFWEGSGWSGVMQSDTDATSGVYAMINT